MPTRTANATWNGRLKDGNGNFRGETGLAGAYNFSSRFENGTGSNPEELLAAAHAACFSMALSGALEKAGTPSTRVDTTAKCTVEKRDEGFRITTIRLAVQVAAPGLTNEALQKAVADTKVGCPVSKALANNVDIQVDATLSS